MSRYTTTIVFCYSTAYILDLHHNVFFSLSQQLKAATTSAEGASAIAETVAEMQTKVDQAAEYIAYQTEQMVEMTAANEAQQVELTAVTSELEVKTAEMAELMSQLDGLKQVGLFLC